jgi:hypothetical protein
MTNGEITTLTDTLKILPAIFQISPAHATSAAIFTLLAQWKPSKSEQHNYPKAKIATYFEKTSLKFKYTLVQKR